MGVKQRAGGTPKQRAEWGLKSLLFFARHICGFYDLTDELHGEICKEIQKEVWENGGNLVVEIPRDHFKSSIGQAAMIWIPLVYHKLTGKWDFRILIDTSTMDLSRKHIMWIKRTLESEEFIKTYGDLLGGSQKATQEEIYLGCRGGDDNVKEPNWKASSIESEKTGGHYDMIWYDDLTGEKNYDTRALRDKTVNHFYFSLSLLEPGGRLFYTDTPWHDADCSGVLKRKDADLVKAGKKPLFKWYHRAALERDRQPDEVHGTPIFPERFPLEVLHDKRASMPRFIWCAQWMTDPAVPEFAIPFDRAMLYTPRAQFPALRFVTATIDANFLEEEQLSGDYACIVVGGFDDRANWWGVEVRMGRWDSRTLMEHMFDIKKKFRPAMFRIEDKFTSHLLSAIRTEESVRREYLNIDTISRDLRSKKMRYAGIYPFFIAHRIRFAKEIDDTVKIEMEDELTRAGASKNDDFLDCLTDQFVAVFPMMQRADEQARRQDIVQRKPTLSTFGFDTIYEDEIAEVDA